MALLNREQYDIIAEHRPDLECLVDPNRGSLRGLPGE
jgi:hypothetical protein